MEYIQNKKAYIGISCLVSFFLVFHYLFGYLGHYGYDDVLGYMYQAAQVVQGNFELGDDHYAYRWGIIFLTALSYSIFGIQDTAGALMPMLITLTTSLLIFWVLRKQAFLVGLLAVLIFTLNEWTLFYSDKVMPDILVALTGFGLFALLWHLRYQAKQPSAVKYALGFSSILLFAFLSKETIILLLPVFFLIFVADIRQKQHLQFWKYNILFSIALFALYFSFIKLQTGSFMYRFKAIELGGYFNPCSYDQLPIEHMIERLTTGLFYLFTKSSLMVCLVLALPSLLQHKIKELLQFSNERAFWAAVLILSFFSSYYMTISYKSYIPMCGTDVRHFLYLAPLAAVSAAPYLHDFFKTKRYAAILSIGSLAVFALSYWQEYEVTYPAYLSILVVIVLRVLIPISFLKDKITTLFTVGLTIALALPAWYNMQYARTIEYTKQRAMIYKYLAPDAPQKTLVVTNIIQRNFGEYYMGFNKDSQVKFVTYEDAKSMDFSPYQAFYIFLNGHTRYSSGLAWEELPKCVHDYFAGQPNPSFEVIEQHGKDRILLCRIKDSKLLK